MKRRRKYSRLYPLRGSITPVKNVLCTSTSWDRTFQSFSSPAQSTAPKCPKTFTGKGCWFSPSWMLLLRVSCSDPCSDIGSDCGNIEKWHRDEWRRGKVWKGAKSRTLPPHPLFTIQKRTLLFHFLWEQIRQVKRLVCQPMSHLVWLRARNVNVTGMSRDDACGLQQEISS